MLLAKVRVILILYEIAQLPILGTGIASVFVFVA